MNCYNESEAVTGFFTMIEDQLEVPFGAAVPGADVTVTDFELTERGKSSPSAPMAGSDSGFRFATYLCRRRRRRVRSGLRPIVIGPRTIEEGES